MLTSQAPLELEYQTKLRDIVFLCFRKIDEIHSGSCDRLVAFQRYNEAKFKADMDYFCKGLTDKASQLSVIGRPTSESSLKEAMKLAETMEMAARSITVLVITIPESRGRLLTKQVRNICVDLVKSIASLVNSFLEVPLDTRVHCDYFFASSTAIFDVCDQLKRIPTNNSVAMVGCWEECCELLQDVINEIEELQEDNGFFDFDDEAFENEGAALNDEEKAMIKRSLALIKVTRILFKKIMIRCIKDCDVSCTEKIEWLDNLYDHSQEVMALVDELGCSLHGPQNAQIVSMSASKLTNCCSHLIEMAKVFAPEEHLSWFEKCGEQYHKILVSIHERNPQR